MAVLAIFSAAFLIFDGFMKTRHAKDHKKEAQEIERSMEYVTFVKLMRSETFSELFYALKFIQLLLCLSYGLDIKKQAT